MRILITGTAGFIGHHMAHRLSSAGWDVTGIDNLNSYYDVQLKYDRLAQQGFSGPFTYGVPVVHPRMPSRFVQMDLCDKTGLTALFGQGRFDYVINLAAQAGVRYSLTNPQEYIDSNVTGFLNLLEACRAFPVKHLVFASSSSVYGLNRHVPFSEKAHADHPISLYAASKKSNEMMAHAYAHLFGIPVTGLRFFTVYGPWGRPDMAIYLFTKAVYEGQPLSVFNHGVMMRDFTYVDDITESVYRMLASPPVPDPSFDHMNPDPDGSSAPYRLFNIGNNHPESLMSLIGFIEEATGRKASLHHKPMQPGDLPSTCADVEHLAALTGFRPSTSLRDGVNRFVSWFRTYHGYDATQIPQPGDEHTAQKITA